MSEEKKKRRKAKSKQGTDVELERKEKRGLLPTQLRESERERKGGSEDGDHSTLTSLLSNKVAGTCMAVHALAMQVSVECAHRTGAGELRYP